MDVREKHRSVAPHLHPDQGPPVRTLTRDRAHSLLLHRTTLQPTESLGQLLKTRGVAPTRHSLFPKSAWSSQEHGHPNPSLGFRLGPVLERKKY